jgi:hypothetical protein
MTAIKYERTVEVSPGEWKHYDVTAIIEATVDTIRSAQRICGCKEREQRMSSAQMCVGCMALDQCIDMLVPS